MKNTIAAIIPTYRRWPYTLATLAQLDAQSRRPDEVVVVDQTPESEIDDMLRSTLERINKRTDTRIVRQDQPHVYRARNLAARLASSDLLLFLDDDVIIQSDYIEQFVRSFAEHSDAAAIIGYLSGPSDFGRTASLPKTDNPEEFIFRFKMQLDHVQRGIPYTCAGNMVIKRKILFGIGGWDEKILTYGDKDLGMRLYRNGYDITYDPGPKMIHLSAPLGGTRLTDERSPWEAWERCVSIHYLAFKHLHGISFVKYGLYRSMRYSFLLKQNAIRPWRWPREIAGWTKALAVARHWAAEKQTD